MVCLDTAIHVLYLSELKSKPACFAVHNDRGPQLNAFLQLMHGVLNLHAHIHSLDYFITR